MGEMHASTPNALARVVGCLPGQNGGGITGGAPGGDQAAGPREEVAIGTPSPIQAALLQGR